MKSSTCRIALSILTVAIFAACSSNSRSVDEGQVQLTITSVPTDVQCIKLTASNGSSVAVRDFDVIPQQSANVNVNGLPTGTVTLTEAAYDTTCDFVTAQTPPSWLSKAPVVVQLQPGQVATVNIELVRPGSVSITNSFTDNTAVDGGADAPASLDGGSLDQSTIRLDGGSLDQSTIRLDGGSLDQSIIRLDGGSLDQSTIRLDGGSLDQSTIRLDGGSLDQSTIRLDGGSLDQSTIRLDGGSLDQSTIRLDGGSLDQASVADSSTDNPVTGVVYRINAGSTSGASPFAADQYYSGGTGRTTTNTITITGITNPAPAAVYQSERYGATTYTFPGLVVGQSYTVRLHFAELYWTATGKRVFNVAINGATVLSNFDIYSAAGNAGNKAVLREFTTTANSSGQIIVAFTNVTDNASIEGIEIAY